MSGFTSKVGELIADYKHRLMDGIENFKLGLKSLQENLMSLSAKASDVEKEIKNVEISGRIKRKREVEEWLKAVRSIEKEVVELGAKVESEGIKSVIDGGQVTRLNEEVVKLHEQSQDFGTMAVDVYGIVGGETSLTSGLVGKSFNENLERSLELLNSREVSSIGVYGMGGVGKTTLAKHIYNRLIQQCKGRVLWVTVSQDFSVMSLQDKIALLVGSDLSDKDNEEERAVRLCAALSQMKNSTLILDDVWEKIDISKIGCPVSVEYCRLIVTSRSLTVCHQLGCQKLIRVEKLCEDEAWKLFSETLQIEINLSPQVEEVAKSVAKLCDGLPLGVITLGGIMRGERSVHTWRNALDELKERVSGKDGMELEEVFEVLKFSFDRLNTNYRSQNREFNTVQLCFLYCVLYPEDYQIYRDDLVRGFLSEGLMDERRSWRAQVDQGHAILDKLVNVGLLESCVDYHGVEFVRMHDLVRGMAMKICEGKFMVNAGNPSLTDIYDEGEWTEDLEKVSLMRNGIRTIGDGTSPNCPRLSTLLLRENPLKAIPDSFLSRMQRLSTLDLCRTRITMLPESVADLINLKALLVEECTKLEKVPYLGKMKALRELNLSRTAIEEVPQGVEELFNLRFLSLDSHKLKMLPRGLLFKLRHLQCVKYPVHIQASIEEVEHLKRLEQFWGALNSIRDFNCFIKSRVHDAFYKIQVGPSPCEEEERRQVYEREVSLLDCDLGDEKVLGGDIEGLRIRECEGLRYRLLDVFSPSSYPKSLKRLIIQECRELERISTSEEQSLFMNLEYIKLEELDDLKELFQPSAASVPSAFSSLMSLFISRCNKITKLRLPALGVPNLEEITISRCGEMEEIFDDEENSLASLPRLKQLRLSELPRLKSVCKATLICDSIQVIRIQECPMLKKLPLHLDVSFPTSLEQIEIDRERWESLEWGNTELPQLLFPFVSFF